MKPFIHRYWADVLIPLESKVTQHAISYGNKSEKQIAGACYFLKLRNTGTSTKILLEQRLIQDSRVLVRVLFENAIYLKALVIENEDFFRTAYGKDWFTRRKRTIRDLKNMFSESEAADGKTFVGMLDVVDKKNEEVGKSLPDNELKSKEYGLKIKDLAIKYGEEKGYTTFY